MATAIIMPDFGTTVEQVKLVRWLKAVGDAVKRGDMLCEVETDKATSELESIAEGVVLKQLVPEGEDVQQGTIIAYVGAPGEVVPTAQQPKPAATSSASTGGTPVAPNTVPTAAAPIATAAAGARISPMVRRLAEREGVDLAKVVGTGQGGLITRDDVLKAKAAGVPPAAAKGATGKPLPKEQAAVARRVARSNREIPTIDLMTSIDMSAVIRARQKLMDESSRKVAYDTFFLYAAAQAIKKFPSFAGHASDEQFFPAESIDVCLAVSHDNRLYLPVVRGADKLPVRQIQTEIERIVEKIRRGTVGTAELAGGCFTISNLGMYPVEFFQMIIPPDQSAALAIGATQDRPVVVDSQIAVRPLCTIALSVDHRIINGVEAAEFLKNLKDTLETL